MKKRLFLFCFLYCSFVNWTHSMPVNKDKYNQLRQTLDTVSIDSATVGQRYGALLDEIFLDNAQVINALSSQNDSLKKSMAKVETDYQSVAQKLKFYLYAVLGVGALTLIFLVLVVLYIFKSTKLNKSLTHKNIEQGKLKTEVEELSSKLTTALEQQKMTLEQYTKEKNQLLSQIQLKNTENEQLKTSLEKKEVDYNQLLEQFQQKTTEQGQLSKTMSEKDAALLTTQQSLENLKIQYHTLKNEHQQLQLDFQQEQKKSNELILHITELTEKNNALLHQLEILTNEWNTIKQQNEKLTDDMQQLQQAYDALKQIADEANEARNRVDEALKKFVEELQTMLPLPKN